MISQYNYIGLYYCVLFIVLHITTDEDGCNTIKVPQKEFMGEFIFLCNPICSTFEKNS